MGGIPSGKLSDEELPAVGDWVAVRPVAGEKKAVIEAVLAAAHVVHAQGGLTANRRPGGRGQRRHRVRRHRVRVRSQPGRLERYLTSAWDSGASPVIVVNKSDLADDPEAELLEVEPVVMGVPVHSVSAVTGAGLEALEPYLGRAGRLPCSARRVSESRRS